MSYQFAIVWSEFNTEITTPLFEGAFARLIERGLTPEQIDVVKVPGAVEIPLITQLLAKQNKHAAIICLGAVIRGETSHYDFVCQQVSHGLQKVMLDYNLPIVFGILTTDNEEQARDRVGGAFGHKGVESADTAILMAQIVEKILTD